MQYTVLFPLSQSQKALYGETSSSSPSPPAVSGGPALAAQVLEACQEKLSTSPVAQQCSSAFPKPGLLPPTAPRPALVSEPQPCTQTGPARAVAHLSPPPLSQSGTSTTCRFSFGTLQTGQTCISKAEPKSSSP